MKRIVCKQCGKKSWSNRAYCSKCGASLKEETTEIEPHQEEQASEQKKGRKKEILIGGFIAFFVMIGGIFLFQPKIESISASYSGDRSEGVVLDENNKGIHN